jgi:hypothetical protein
VTLQDVLEHVRILSVTLQHVTEHVRILPEEVHFTPADVPQAFTASRRMAAATKVKEGKSHLKTVMSMEIERFSNSYSR